MFQALKPSLQISCSTRATERLLTELADPVIERDDFAPLCEGRFGDVERVAVADHKVTCHEHAGWACQVPAHKSCAVRLWQIVAAQDLSHDRFGFVCGRRRHPSGLRCCVFFLFRFFSGPPDLGDAFKGRTCSWFQRGLFVVYLWHQAPQRTACLSSQDAVTGRAVQCRARGGCTGLPARFCPFGLPRSTVT